MFSFFITVFLIWLVYKFVKAYISAKSQIRSQEYGKEARHLAIDEFGVPVEFYNSIVQNSMDVLKESALEMRESISEYRDVSWPRMLAWTIYLSYLNMCKSYLKGDSLAKKTLKVFSISDDQVARVVSQEILDPFRNQILHAEIPKKTNYSWESELYAWEQNCERSFLEKDVEELRKQKVLQIVDDRLLTHLPEEIAYLKELEEISIYYCYYFTSFPKSISQMENLKKIELFECLGMKGLQEHLGDISNLKTLILSGVPITSISDSLGKLTNLEELYIEDCRELTEVGSFIGRLKNLKKLRIENCDKLEIIDASIYILENLEEVCISNNENLNFNTEKFLKSYKS